MPNSHSLLHLPNAPEHLTGPVKAWDQPVEILTYSPEAPDRNPMFLEKRVYQGSSGRVYPLPFIDRIATAPAPRLWQAIHIENEYLRLTILPEIGGRIHVGYDKITGYDFFYRQNVIKPALVGLAGPWISGGVEFNWPQHHRPATFMPVATEIEHHPGGAITVWCGDHDPMLRMKGMHGVCLHPGRAVLELKARLFNRTQFTQTFLWWANVATRVHERYQSFFPTDVRFVADHAKRAITSFPRSDRAYYGVDYAERARTGVPAEEAPRCFVPDGSYPANDLSWYANIPVATSYMITGTGEDFFGGYDHAAKAGVVHVADHHIAPGKKQWTWGNHEFGYAWDRSLTDDDGPYIELMAGVYTDNQPDFSWLSPWETKTFTQNWFPIHAIGVPQAANVDAALSLRVDGPTAHLGLLVTRNLGDAEVTLRACKLEIARWTRALSVGSPLLLSADLPPSTLFNDLSVTVVQGEHEVIAYTPGSIVPASTPVVAVEPPSPADTATNEELYLTGLHLEQYRHATRQPELYCQEALRRDPGDSRVNNALGLWHLQRAEFDAAAQHFATAIARLTQLNPNPRDGEPFYNLGVAERFRNRAAQAYDAFYKATWSAAWRGPAYLALAELDAAKRDWPTALDHIERALRADTDNLNARNLRCLVLRYMHRDAEAAQAAADIRALDPLDAASRWHEGLPPADGQQALDLAFDLLRSGQTGEAIAFLRQADLNANDGSAPLLLFTLAHAQSMLGQADANAILDRATAASIDYCFPSRLEEFLILEIVLAERPDCSAAHYLLGNFLYDRRRHLEAIEHWEAAAALNPGFPTVWRNLGIARFNILGDVSAARAAFDRALAANPRDARVLYERDQLSRRAGVEASHRLDELLRFPALIDLRDDLSVETATLYNQIGQSLKALNLLLHRKFQPWEGGEGLVLGQYVRTRLLLGRSALEADDSKVAIEHLTSALHPPANLSEANHLLANQSEIFFWIGAAYAQAGDAATAASWWERATRQRGDFQQMAVRTISTMSFWTGMANLRLGRHDQARTLFRQILDYSFELEATEPKIDYFATSLPAMLLFEEDLSRRNRIDALFLRAQALTGLAQTDAADTLLQTVLDLDCNHSGAADLLHHTPSLQR
jgi:tetratricopeptide (TPR) repeat protein